MAELVLVAKFVQASAKVFQNYLDYMDRENARAKTGETFKTAFSAFADYMRDDDKSTGLFDNWNDNMNDYQVQRQKEKFAAAQTAGGNMWQQVISFTPEFLVENNIDIAGSIQEDLLKDATRKAINAELKAENMLGNVVWNGAIHYNTDNLHVHIAFVEKEVTRTRGKFKTSSLNKAKAAVLSTLAPRTKEQELLNQQRTALVHAMEEHDDVLAISAAIRSIQKELPTHGRLQYNSSHLSDEFRSLIDEEVRYLLDTVLKFEYDLYMDGLKQEEAFYKKSYGAGKTAIYPDYVSNKEQELFARVGNVLLKGAVTIRKLEQENTNVTIAGKKYCKYSKPYQERMAELSRQYKLKHAMRRILEEARRESEQAQKETDLALLGYSL
jgi:hypothetical protein